MSVWHSVFTDLMRARYSALIAYAGLLVDDPAGARDLADEAVAEVFSHRLAPHGTGAAERAAREWMAKRAVADGVPAERVAAVLVAVDGLQDDGVRDVLGKLSPDPLPAVSAEDASDLRRRFSEVASVYATPSGGNSAVMAPAKRRRRSALLGAAAGTAVAIFALGSVAYAGVKYVPGALADDAATASASPSPTVLAVTWHPQVEAMAARQGFIYPECGDNFEPEPQTVNGISGAPSIERFNDEDMGTFVILSEGFATDSGEVRNVLSGAGGFVVTLNDLVMFTTGSEYNGTNLFLANGSGGNGGAGLNRMNFCDTVEERAALEKEFADLDWATATQEDQEEYDRAWKDLAKQIGDFPPGTYKIYQVSPVIFGEQAALAAVFAQEGLGDISSLEFNISWSELSRDPSMAPYCIGSWDLGDWQCTPPPEVVEALLTREIDPTTIEEAEGGLVISEPFEYVVD